MADLMNPLVEEDNQSNVEMRHSQIALEVNFEQKPPPLESVPFTSLSKFFGDSKKTYSTSKILLTAVDSSFLKRNAFIDGDKVVKYNSRDMQGYRALVTTTNTILTNMTTWSSIYLSP